MEEKESRERVIAEILEAYGLGTAFCEPKAYIDRHSDEGRIKLIQSVVLGNGQRVVVKILRTDDDLLQDREKIERQSAFSEYMRQNGILTPKRYMARGRYCNEFFYLGVACNVTVEDWCGEEIQVLDTEIAYQIGELMAKMHVLSLENECKIGCGTLFSAAYWNDVDCFDSFCKIGGNENLNQRVVEKIKVIRGEKLEALRSVWDTLPKAAVQGDISINNLVDGEQGLVVFDYNNAGDEVLVSDLVMEGLLTAYEMDIAEGADEGCRETFFPAFLRGYLSVRKLRRDEAEAAWNIYTLYHALWFTRVVYSEGSLEKLVERGEYAAANKLLEQMLADITECDDGRFLVAP